MPSIDDLLLKINDYGLDTLLSLTKIQTAEQQEFYRSMGYLPFMTAERFTKTFPDIPADKVWYTPSLSLQCCYYNPDTLAVLSLDSLMMATDKFYKLAVEAIKTVEDACARGDFAKAIFVWPDKMKIDYLRKVLQEKIDLVPDPYKFFVDVYSLADYGFTTVDQEWLQLAVSRKTDAQKAETIKKLSGLPGRVTIWRGGNSASTPPEQSYSWSLSPITANFFAVRLGNGPAYITKGQASKDKIIELIETRDEQEILISPSDIEITETIDLFGLDFLEEVFPAVTSRYHAYLSRMERLHFAQDSELHGKLHEARVLLLCLIYGKLLKLSVADRNVLCTAAIYHDTMRKNDGVEHTHGAESRVYYESDIAFPDPIVSFLCEYHCLPDEDAYKAIASTPALQEHADRVKRLYGIFKDADALDRVRFGIKDVDVTRFRIPESWKLSLVARMLFQNIQIESTRRS